jgi:hypothetical protein
MAVIMPTLNGVGLYKSATTKTSTFARFSDAINRLGIS